ncbi:hypothetical protein Q1J52_11275, partial [Pseudomonas lijiangensis]|uniref:hypothetical protein n=1 Tax=Pseudomonas lijiangensis TaxID=2995658 RepID=UPI0034D538D7
KSAQTSAHLRKNLRRRRKRLAHKAWQRFLGGFLKEGCASICASRLDASNHQKARCREQRAF